MTLRAPNVALFVIAWCLAMLGVLAAQPIALPIPGLSGNSSWYIFLAWFLLSAGAVVATLDENSAKARDKRTPQPLSHFAPSGQPAMLIGVERDADRR
jgi:hypothetical protein